MSKPEPQTELVALAHEIAKEWTPHSHGPWCGECVEFAALDAGVLAAALKASGVGCSASSEPDVHDDCIEDHGAAEVLAALVERQ